MAYGTVGQPAVGITTLEFKVRVISSVGPDSPAVLVNFASEDYQMWFYLFPNKITMGGQGIGNTAACTMDTTNKFHTYRITSINNHANLYVDNNPEPAVDLVDSLTPATESRICFGDMNSG